MNEKDIKDKLKLKINDILKLYALEVLTNCVDNVDRKVSEKFITEKYTNMILNLFKKK